MKRDRMKSRSLVLLVALFGLIFSVSPAGAEDRYPVRPLTDDPAQEGFPTWSPDGSEIVYSYSRMIDSAMVFGLFKKDAEGGEPTRLTDFIGEHPVFSPDGRMIAFDADTGNAVKIISAHGGDPISPIPDSIPIFRGGNPNWSPDGNRLAFREGSNLWLHDLRTAESRVVFTKKGFYPLPCCWSRDGEAIYVCLRGIESHESALWKISLSGEMLLRLTSDRPGVYRYMDLSPDGSLIAFVACEEKDCDIWAMPADGGGAVRLTGDPAYDDTPRWSPDGTRIAFTSTRTGRFDVWVMEVDLADLAHAIREATD